MDEREPAIDDRIDPVRTLFLGACTTMLLVAFLLLLIGDSVSATTF